MCAARSGRVPLIEYLVERGADIEARDIVSDGHHYKLAYSQMYDTVLISVESHR